MLPEWLPIQLAGNSKMLTETGRVVGVEDESIWVETVRQSTCGSCAVQKGCGHGLLNRISDGKRGYIRILPGEQSIADYSIDDEVLFSIPEEVILRGSFIAYMLPLLGMLCGSMAAAELLPGNPNLLAIIGAVGGLTAGFALVRWHGVRHRGDPSFQPVLLGIVPVNTEPLTLL